MISWACDQMPPKVLSLPRTHGMSVVDIFEGDIRKAYMKKVRNLQSGGCSLTELSLRQSCIIPYASCTVARSIFHVSLIRTRT